MEKYMSNSTWLTQPETNDWNTATNWDPATLPTDTATFTSSSQTAISFSASDEVIVNNINFSTDAPAYTFTIGSTTSPALTISGQGVGNSSTSCQCFIVAATTVGYQNPQLKFTNSATAGGPDISYCAGPETEQGYGGGVISFCDKSNAGSASFKAWTGAGAPPEHSTVGGEISFSDSSSAETARFTIYGTLGSDGDTFGNVVFHDSSTAANATFTNIGGTVSGGDGGNTQFYNDSTAAYATFNNRGGTYSKANGGDVAFDGTASGGYGYFYNYAAPASDAYGGVTSFNNNPPEVSTQGASAGNAFYHNYGAQESGQGGGGHMEFSAKYGSPTAANATIINCGSAIEDRSSAGHTIFSINLPSNYYPTAGSATIRNQPGVAEGAAAGYTEFSIYGTGSSGENVPTAGNATLINEGGYISGAAGGSTIFSNSTTASNALLIAYGGSNGGYGGQIVFYDDSLGAKASVQLYGNGELNIGDHTGGLNISVLELIGGIISIQLGDNLTSLSLSNELILKSSQATFSFWNKDSGGFEFNTSYTILTAPNLSIFTEDQFSGNSIENVEPTFSIDGNNLMVSFNQ
jgi:hypothetical protein